MIHLDIRPFGGAEPIRFGMPRASVGGILGVPDSSNDTADSWGNLLNINIGYDKSGLVNQFGLRPGDYSLSLDGRVVWSPDNCPDPNPILLALDPEPLERVGFLVFTKLGVATTGYHDDDPGQRAISVYPEGAWDKLILKAKKPNLDKYRVVKS